MGNKRAVKKQTERRADRQCVQGQRAEGGVFVKTVLLQRVSKVRGRVWTGRELDDVEQSMKSR